MPRAYGDWQTYSLVCWKYGKIIFFDVFKRELIRDESYYCVVVLKVVCDIACDQVFNLDFKEYMCAFLPMRYNRKLRILLNVWHKKHIFFPQNIVEVTA